MTFGGAFVATGWKMFWDAIWAIMEEKTDGFDAVGDIVVFGLEIVVWISGP